MHFEKEVLLLIFFICLLLIIVLILSKNYLINVTEVLLEFPTLLLFYLLFLIGLLTSYNFMAIFVNFIGVSIILYTLIGINKKNYLSQETNLKYFTLSGTTNACLGYAMVLIGLIYNNYNFFNIKLLTKMWIWKTDKIVADVNIIYILIILIFVAFAFKLTIFPCHFWSPSLYGSFSPLVFSSAALLNKVSFFVTLIYILGYVFCFYWEIWGFLIWTSALFSLFFGILGALIEQKFQTFLTYSSINQLGFPLAVLSVGTYHAIQVAYFFISVYILTSVIILVVYLSYKYYNTNKKLIFTKDFSIINQMDLHFAVSITLAFFSFSGIPPLAGFFSKFFTLVILLKNNFIFLIIIAITTSMVACYYYLQIIKKKIFSSDLIGPGRCESRGKLSLGILTKKILNISLLFLITTAVII